MSDNLRQYRAIRDALRQAYPGEPQGRCARHLTTLAALISGIVASKSAQLPKVAAKVPNGTKNVWRFHCEQSVLHYRGPSLLYSHGWREAYQSRLTAACVAVGSHTPSVVPLPKARACLRQVPQYQ